MKIQTINTNYNQPNYFAAQKTSIPAFGGFTLKTPAKKRKTIELNPVMRYINKLFERSLVVSRRKNFNPIENIAPFTKEVPIGDIENRTYAWDINKDNRKKYLLFFHGASQNISNVQNLYKRIIEQTDYAVLAAEYRGFGKNTPCPLNTKTFNEDANNALKYLKDKNIDERDITVLGYSFGSIAASLLAKNNPLLNKLILVSAMDSFAGNFDIIRASKNKMPKFIQKLNNWFPFLKSPLKSSMNTIRHLKKVEIPVYIIHSKHDKMVNIAAIENFKKACHTIQKIDIMEDGGHRIDKHKLDSITDILNSY